MSQQITLDSHQFVLTVVTQRCQLVRYKRFGTHYCHSKYFHYSKCKKYIHLCLKLYKNTQAGHYDTIKNTNHLL